MGDLWTSDIAFQDAALRLGAAIVLGGVIGFEREAQHRAAGLRTHILVSLAAALFTIMAFEMYAWVQAQETETNADPLRLLEAITAGVAFLATGAIFRNRGDVSGLTTGAGLWIAGAIGMAVGQGHFALGALATLLAVIVLSLLRLMGSPASDDKGRAEDS